MSKPFNYGTEPFQGFTEFDEWESMDEFGEDELGDLETFESNFDLEAEEETRRLLSGGRSRRAASRPQDRRLMMRAARSGIKGSRRPRPSRPPRPRRPRVFRGYSRFNIPQFFDGSCPSVGRYGNWFRRGDQLIILLEEDAAPLDHGASSAALTNNASGTEVPPEASPGAPGEGGSEGATEGTENEFAGSGRLFRRRLPTRR